jgi:PTH1 family peptidyl-tRNA hydrolase
MKLIVGLGNPGTQYQNNRHNAGFMAAHAIVRRHSFSGPTEKFHSHLYTGTLDGQKNLLLMPHTYMNDSGRAVQTAMTFYKIAPADVVVIHDDIELKLGQLRTKQGGGHAGQNGLRDIDACIGPDYWRVRIGVGHPRDTGSPMDVADYVLSNFTAAERPIIDIIIDEIAANAGLLISPNMTELQNRVALRMQKLSPQ